MKSPKSQETNKKDISNGDSEKVSKVVEYDELLSSAGEFGLYQVLLLLSTCPFYIFAAFSYFTQLFMTEVPANHWCWVPELEQLTPIERRNLAIPLESNGYSHCLAFAANWSRVLESGERPNNSWPKETCPHGWEFNETEIPYPTISSEMEWVCNKDSYQASAQSIYFVGSIVGGLLIGFIADRFGRIPAGITGNVIGCIAGVCSIFARDFTEFSICRFFMGMSYDTSMMMISLLVLEYVAPKHRTMAANLPSGIFFTIGTIVLPSIALACADWRILSLVTSIPMAITILTPFVIPESPRWLLSTGRIDEAVKKVLTIGRINSKEIPGDLIRQFKNSASETDTNQTDSVFEIFRRPVIRRILICVCMEFMCCTIIFDALLRSIGSFAFDFFLSFTLLSLTEIPSILMVSFTLDYTGRKWMTIFMFCICSLFSILTALENGWASVLCAIVARFAVNIIYIVTTQWAAEMFPTGVRGSASSIVHTCGFIATVISPYIVYLKVFIPILPLIIVGIIAAIGAVSSMFLPETAGIELPQTFEEAEGFIKKQKFFDIPMLRKK